MVAGARFAPSVAGGQLERTRRVYRMWMIPVADSVSVGELVDRLSGWLRRLPPAQDRIDRLIGDLSDRFGARLDSISAEVCVDIEHAAWQYCRHLRLEFDPRGTALPDEQSPGWPDPDPAEVGAAAAGVAGLSRLDHGRCVIRLDRLDPLPLAQPYLDAAFALARDARGIVLDLRDNGGGDPSTVARIAGWLLGDASTRLSEVTYRDRRRQWWTPDLPAGTAVPADVPVAVLTSTNTFSSAEALVYHLRSRGRVSVVGEATPGAADHVTPIQLTATVRGLLPEGYVTDAVTGANWEGHGIHPDITCRASEALPTALNHLGGHASTADDSGDRT